MAFLKPVHCDLLRSPLATYLYPLMKKSAAATDGLDNARAELKSPLFQLNCMLDRQMQCQQKVILNIINRMVAECPHVFPLRDSVRQLHNLIVRHLDRSGALKSFTEQELKLDLRYTDPNSSIAKAVGHTPKPDAGQDMDAEKSMEEMEEVCQIYMLADTEEVENALNAMTKKLPQSCFFMKGAILEVKGRLFCAVSGEIRLQPGLQVI